MEFQVYQLFETTVKFHTLRVFNRVTTHIKNGIGFYLSNAILLSPQTIYIVTCFIEEIINILNFCSHFQ